MEEIFFCPSCMAKTAPVDGTHTVGLKSDGTVVAAGRNEEGQRDVSDWSHIKLP